MHELCRWGAKLRVRQCKVYGVRVIGVSRHFFSLGRPLVPVFLPSRTEGLTHFPTSNVSPINLCSYHFLDQPFSIDVIIEVMLDYSSTLKYSTNMCVYSTSIYGAPQFILLR